MKWVLYALAGVGGLLVICVVVLLALGGYRGESRLVASIDIAKPPGTVFPFITQPEKLKSWVSWLVEVKEVAPARQVWVMEDRNNNNQLMNIETDIVRADPGRLLEVNVAAAEGFTGNIRYELESSGSEQTRLTYVGSYKFQHWLAKLLEPVISRSAQQKLEDDLRRLKQQVEAS
jgi:uncharacterized membrane protein